MLKLTRWEWDTSGRARVDTVEVVNELSGTKRRGGGRHPWHHFWEVTTVFQTYLPLQQKFIFETGLPTQLSPKCLMW